MSTFRVAICGAGVGGLVLASILGKHGMVPVDIFEAAPTTATIGAGIGFYGRTMHILKELGVYDDIVKISAKDPHENAGPKFRKSDQQDGYDWFVRRVKGGHLTMHRRDLLDCLLRHIHPSCKIHTSKKLISYKADSETGEITLYFSDGSTAVTDVLVGADGIHSMTRKTMYQNLASFAEDDDSRTRLLDCIDPVFTGILVYRTLITSEKFLREFPDIQPPASLTMFLGRNKHIISFPIIRRGQISVTMYIHNSHAFDTPFEGPWVTDVSEEETLDQFKGWEDRAGALVKCVEKPSRWALHSVRPLPHYVDGQVVLLGDAAHAMETHCGAGAGQAIEDAFVLGRLLTHELTHKGNIRDALKFYEQVRLPFANDVVQQSRDVGRCYSLHDLSADGVASGHESAAELDHVRKSIEDGWEWQDKQGLVWGDIEARWRATCATS